PFSDIDLIRIPEFHDGQIFCTDFDQSQICIRVATYQFGFHTSLVGQFDFNLVSIFNNMVVCHDIPVGRDDYSGTGGTGWSSALRSAWTSEKFLKHIKWTDLLLSSGRTFISGYDVNYRWSDRRCSLSEIRVPRRRCNV